MADLHDLDWTTLTLKVYLEARIDEVMRVMDERDARYATQREDDRQALQLARDALDARLNALNELRKLVSDSQGIYLPREVYDTTVATWTEWREGLERRLAQGAGQGAGIAMSARVAAGLVAAAVAVLTIVVIVSNLASSP